MACLPSCATCLTGNGCLTCATGYTTNQYNNLQASGYQCLQCVSPCLTCQQQVNYCTSCISGYSLIGSKCVQNFNFAFNVTFSTSLYNINQNYFNFIQNLTNTTNSSNQNIVTITNIITNTFFIVIQGNLAPTAASGSIQAGIQFSNLNYALSQNSIINGLQIFSSTLNIVGGNVSYACNVSQCSQCMSSSNITCSICLSGYQLNVLNNTCTLIPKCYIANCDTCFSTVRCGQCNPNFLPSIFGDQCVLCEIQSCILCTSNNTCIQCSPDYSLYLDSCVYCLVSNCLTCNSSNVCSVCQNNYQFNNEGICIYLQCNIAGCSYCSSTNVCQSCQTGYQLSSFNNFCFMCNIINCVSCSQANTCMECQGQNMVLSYNSALCVICNISNCVSCSSNNVCFQCVTGYQLNDFSQENLTQCYPCNIFKCTFCYDTNMCKYCNSGYYLVNGSCQMCNYPCGVYSNNGTCQICQGPYYAMTPIANGSCILQTVPNCNQYSTNTSNNQNITVCTSCSYNYALNTTSNTCYYACTPNCLYCQTQQQPYTCYNCNSGYNLTPNNTCVQQLQCQSANCYECNGSLCINCYYGFYLSSNSTECILCPSYCGSCINETYCAQLKYPMSQILITINSQTFLALCAQTCKICSNINPMICIQCLSGFYLNNSICYPCNQSCMGCNSSNPNQCLLCYPNSYLVGNNCVVCSSSCLTCLQSNTTSCLSCYPGYYLQNNVCVQGCSNNCVQCLSSTVCQICLPGYTLFTNLNQTICVQCVSGCLACVVNMPTVCLTIFQIRSERENLQTNCSLFCAICVQQNCIQCTFGYFLTSSLTCSPNCILPCATCSINNPTKCSSCIAGYIFNSLSYICTPQTNCNGKCLVCPMNYIIQNGQCIQCNLNNCQVCSSSNISQCLSCNPGYYLNPNSNQCNSCSPQCATCITSNKCLQCAFGYVSITSYLLPQNYQCLLCSYPCLTCDNSPNICTSCISGFNLIWSQCISNFYFGFNLTLQTNQSIFNQNYLNFIQALTNTVGSQNSNLLTITNITFGSVIIQGQLAPTAASGTEQVNNQFKIFENFLSQNSSIAGMQISQSSVKLVGGTTDFIPNSTTSNLGIILGICIPVGVLIIAGVIFIIYKRKKKQLQNQLNISDDFRKQFRQSFELGNIEKQSENTKRIF